MSSGAAGSRRAYGPAGLAGLLTLNEARKSWENASSVAVVNRRLRFQPWTMSHADAPRLHPVDVEPGPAAPHWVTGTGAGQPSLAVVARLQGEGHTASLNAVVARSPYGKGKTSEALDRLVLDGKLVQSREGQQRVFKLSE